MRAKKSNTIFIEDSTVKEGLDSITVMQIVNGKNIFIGNIYREHYKDKEKITYIAVDFEYTKIFNKTEDINALKRKFIKHGETMAMFAPVEQNREFRIIDGNVSEEVVRMRQLINIRGQNKDRKKKIER
jgi:hypothetical protein